MTLDLALFIVYAAGAVIGALGLVGSKRLVHGVMWLLVSLVSIGALFLSMGSGFLGALQLFVYGGAITILVLFVLMLSQPSPEAVERPAPATRRTGLLTSAALFAVVATAATGLTTPPAADAPDVARLAETLFTRYLVPFEIAGLLLTIALVGAIVIARPEPIGPPPAEESAANAGVEGDAV